MEKPFILYGNERRYFEPPSDWKILTFAAFEDHPGERDTARLTQKALRRPMGSAPLRDCISPSDRVAILIEDQTRSSPKRAVLKALLEELEDVRIARENITVVVALGTHKGLLPGERGALYGDEAVRDYAFINHDCHAPDLVPVGRLETGTAVKINRNVYDATYRIGVGSIFPHPVNGFGGGTKILFPGVADFDSIFEHHLKYSFRGGSELGELEGNPFYEEVCRLGRAGGLHFVINSVLDHNDNLYEVVCGDPIKAHRAGIDICRGIVSKGFYKKADLTLISAFPYTEGPQIMKPLAPASLITKGGGVVILVAHSTTPLPEMYLEGCERFRRRYGGRLREAVLELFGSNRRIMEEGSPELNLSMAQAFLGQNDFNIILVSEDIPRDAAERAGFFYARDLREAFALSATFLTGPEVHIVPSGGVILPVLKESEPRHL